MYDSYQDAHEGTVTARQARREIERHHVAWEAFTAACGVSETYTGAVVLDWLGY